ncbi:MAG: amidohydrolase [Nitrososphaerota archaeon]|nr:amidohydrolase [Nitrososphaerota archaeon]MDG7026502.1 amidohydrolase [Nitrososphaerota archaeon]
MNADISQDLGHIATRKKKLPSSVSDLEGEIRGVSRFVYMHPELGSEEFQASKLLASKLGDNGFKVTSDFLGMETSFLAEIGSGEPKVAIFAEYDALPIGHGCGHNLMAAWAFGVAASLAKEGLPRGTLYVAGSPAEEGYGKYAQSKIVIGPRLKELGTEAVFSMHPMGMWGVGWRMLASTRISFVFHGRDSHAALSPQDGLNALDAAVQFYMQAKMLRNLVRRDKDVILSAIIKDGGALPNVVPGRSEVWMDIRANETSYVLELEGKVLQIAQGAATMTGCTMEWTRLGKFLDSFKRHTELEGLYYKHALEYLGKVGSPDESWSSLAVASSDISNVSQIIPTVHLSVKIGREGLPGHSEEWKNCAGTVEAEEALLTSIAIANDSIIEYLSQR